MAAEAERTSIHVDVGVGAGTLSVGYLATLGLSQPAGSLGRWVLEGGIGPRPAAPAPVMTDFSFTGQFVSVTPSPIWFGLIGLEARGAAHRESVAFGRLEFGAAVAHGGIDVPGRVALISGSGSGRTIVSPAISIALGLRGASGAGWRPLVTARLLDMPGFAEHEVFGSLGFGVGW